MPKNNKKIQRGARRLQSPSSMQVGLPSVRKVRMRYVSYIDLAGTSGALGTQIVGAGDLHDPDKTGVGHQPLGYDQWTAFYTNYVVERSTLHVEYAQSSTTSAVAGIFLSQANGISATSWPELAEQGRSVHKLMNCGAGQPNTRLSLAFDAKRMFNLQSVLDNEDRIGAAFGSSPSGSAMYFVIFVQAHDESTTVPVQVSYTIDYDVIVSEPKEIAQS
jgi:hypothetical protein